MALIDILNNFTRPASIGTKVLQTGAGTSDSVLIPEGIQLPITLNLIVRSAGTAKVQFSTSPRGDILSGASVTWSDWDPGNVTATTAMMCGAVTGFRIVVTSGNWTLEIKTA